VPTREQSIAEGRCLLEQSEDPGVLVALMRCFQAGYFSLADSPDGGVWAACDHCPAVYAPEAEQAILQLDEELRDITRAQKEGGGDGDR